MNCKICDEPLCASMPTINGYSRGTSFEIAHCLNCDTKFSLPLQSDGRVYEYIYSQVKTVPGYSRYFRIAEAVKDSKNPLDFLSRQEEAYWGIAVQLASLARPEDKVIEVGCGQGYLTYSLIRSGYDAVGLDISRVAVDLATERYGNFYSCCSIEKYVHDIGKAPNHVIMSEVIEHLENPMAVVHEAFSALAPGGSLIMTTPNMEAYPGAVWDTDLPPVHLFWFSYQSFRKIGASLKADTSFFNFHEYYSKYPKIKYPADAGKKQ